jgi:hypothetical protein
MRKFDEFMDRLVQAAFDAAKLVGFLMIVSAVVMFITVFFLAIFGGLP